MESTLHDLGALLLKAIPTVLLLLLVHFYLKAVFFRPMADVLAKRRAATEGLKESAEAMRAKAEQQLASIDAKLRQAHEEIYHEQEEARKRWIAEQASQLEVARSEARDLIQQGKNRLASETGVAKSQLATTAEALADQIVRTLLERSAA
jgi:F-type H+-transporting ATPase subunit b